MDPERQKKALEILGMSGEDMQKTIAYSTDKYKYGVVHAWINITVFFCFLVAGGLGYFENWAMTLAGDYDSNQIIVGLIMFGLLGIVFGIYGIPFDYYETFVIEERHGFNKQTLKGFIIDFLKSFVIGTLLGGLILFSILWIMGKMGDFWWFWAWVAMSVFSILTVFIYPTLLAPLFNKFKPLEDGELKEKINSLAEKIGFKTAGLFVMDASKRTTHGNAYFTGLFGKKRIVLFDTLIESLSVNEIIAVLAHELGHFKLKHIRWALIRGIFFTGIIFYLLSLCLPLEIFYQAFKLQGTSNYGALIVFSLWFGLLDFFLEPISTYISRRNEFAADKFANEKIENTKDLGTALLKLREKSHSMPITHPLYSAIYYSHPPLIERLKKMGFVMPQ